MTPARIAFGALRVEGGWRAVVRTAGPELLASPVLPTRAAALSAGFALSTSTDSPEGAQP